MSKKKLLILFISIFSQNVYCWPNISLPNAPNLGGTIFESIDHALKEVSGKAAEDRTNEARAQAREAQIELDKARSMLAEKKEQQDKLEKNIEILKKQQNALKNEFQMSINKIGNHLTSTMMVFDSINNDHMEIDKHSVELNAKLIEFKKHFTNLYVSNNHLNNQFEPYDDQVASLHLLKTLAETEIEELDKNSNKIILETYGSSLSLVGKNYQKLHTSVQTQLEQTKYALDNQLSGQMSNRIQIVQEKSASIQSKINLMNKELSGLLNSLTNLDGK